MPHPSNRPQPRESQQWARSFLEDCSYQAQQWKLMIRYGGSLRAVEECFICLICYHQNKPCLRRFTNKGCEKLAAQHVASHPEAKKLHDLWTATKGFGSTSFRKKALPEDLMEALLVASATTGPTINAFSSPIWQYLFEQMGLNQVYKKIDEADLVVVNWDGWSSNFRRQRKVGIAVRCINFGNMKAPSYLLDLVQVQGREDAPSLANVFRSSLLYHGLASLSSETFNEYTVMNPHSNKPVVSPASASNLTPEMIDSFVLSPKFGGSISDSQETIVKIHKMLNIVRQPCVQHAIHNVVLAALKGSSLYEFFQVLVQLVKSIRKSSLLSDVLVDLQRIEGLVEEYMLLFFSETRWEGIPIFLKRVLLLWSSLATMENVLRTGRQVLKDLAIQLPEDWIFTDSTKNEIEEMLALLEPLKDLVSEFLGNSDQPATTIFQTAPAIIAAYQRLAYLVTNELIQTQEGELSNVAEFGLRLLDFYNSKLLRPMRLFIDTAPNISALSISTVALAVNPILVQNIRSALEGRDPLYRALFLPAQGSAQSQQSFIEEVEAFVLPSYLQLSSDDDKNYPAKPTTTIDERAEEGSLTADDIYKLLDSVLSAPISNSSSMDVDEEVHIGTATVPDEATHASRNRPNSPPGPARTNSLAPPQDPRDARMRDWEQFYNNGLKYITPPAVVPPVLNRDVGLNEAEECAFDLELCVSLQSRYKLLSNLLFVGYTYIRETTDDKTLMLHYEAFVRHYNIDKTGSLLKPNASSPSSSNAIKRPSLLRDSFSTSNTGNSRSSRSPISSISEEDTTESAALRSFRMLKSSSRPPNADNPLENSDLLKPDNSIAYEVTWRLFGFVPSSSFIERTFSTPADTINKKQGALSPETFTQLVLIADMYRRKDFIAFSEQVMDWGSQPTEEQAIRKALIQDDEVSFEHAVYLSSTSKDSNLEDSHMPVRMTSYSSHRTIDSAQERLQSLTGKPSSTSRSVLQTASAKDISNATHTLSALDPSILHAVERAVERRELEQTAQTPSHLSRRRANVWDALHSVHTTMISSKAVPPNLPQHLKKVFEENLDTGERVDPFALIDEHFPSVPNSRSLVRCTSFIEALLNCVASETPWNRVSQSVNDILAESKRKVRATQTGPTAASSPSAQNSVTKRTPTTKKRDRSSAMDPLFDDSDDESSLALSNAHSAHSSSSSQLAQAFKMPSSNYIVFMVDRILKRTAQDQSAARREFTKLLSTTLSSLPSVDLLVRMLPSIPDDLISKVIYDFREGIRQGQAAKDVIPLLLVHLNSTLHQTNKSVTSNSTTKRSNTTQADNASTAMEISDDDNQGDEAMFPGLHAAIRASFEEWTAKNAQFREELNWLKQYAASKDCFLANVPGDGNCLYYAICLILLVLRRIRKPMDQMELRQLLTAHMENKDKDWFESVGKVDEYISSQKQNGTWGDRNVIRAAAEKYRILFNVTVTNRGSERIGKLSVKSSDQVELLLVGLNHYMFACPNNLALIVQEDPNVIPL